MDTTLFVPEEEVMAKTGLTKIQVRNDIRKERMPGNIYRRKPVILRAEWNAYLAGEWQPRKRTNPIRHINNGRAA